MIFTKNGQIGLFNKRLPYPKQLNKNSLVVGIPGDGKTFTYVKPNIMQENSSFVITDPKGLLVREVGSMLENDGYTIKVFDLVNLTNSDTFNVFNYMKSELDIDRVSEAIVDGTKKSDKQVFVNTFFRSPVAVNAPSFIKAALLKNGKISSV